MKPVNQFHEKIETITLVVSEIDTPSVKGMLETLGLTVHSENMTDKRETVIVVKNMELSDLHLFDLNDPSKCYVHYYVLNTDELKVFFHTSYTNKNIGTINIMYVYEKEGQQRTRSIVDIYEDRQIGGDYPTSYHLNWSAWGSQDIYTANSFANGLKLAVDLTEQCIKKYVKK